MNFLHSYPPLIAAVFYSILDPQWEIRLGGLSLDAVVLSNLTAATRVPNLEFVSFLPSSQTPFAEDKKSFDKKIISYVNKLSFIEKNFDGGKYIKQQSKRYSLI